MSEHVCDERTGKVKKMAVNETPPVRRKIIGNRLRELREASGMSVEKVAGLMGVSRAAAYRQEAGHTSVSVADAEKYFRIYGVEDTPIAEHITTLVIGDKTSDLKKVPKEVKNYGPQAEVAELEEMATRIFHYEPMMIGGLLQCAEYMDASLLPLKSKNDEVINLTISLRRKRQEILYRRNRPEMTFIMTEAALQYQVGSHEVMRSQTRHLIKLIREHRVDVRLLAFSSGFLPGMSQPSLLVEIGTQNPVSVAYYDAVHYGKLADAEAMVSLTREKFNTLKGHAEDPEKTAQILENYYE